MLSSIDVVFEESSIYDEQESYEGKGSNHLVLKEKIQETFIPKLLKECKDDV